MPHVVPSVDPYSDHISVTSYVPSVNTSRAPSEQHVGAIQEEKRTTLEQVKGLESIIAPGEIKIDKGAHLRELYMIRLKHVICILETNVNKFSEEKKPHKA